MTLPLPHRSRLSGLIGAGLAAALLLSGCSGAEAPATPSGSGLLPAAEGAVAYPLTLSSQYGETVLDKRPERIAAIVGNALDAELLLALGVTPILASSMINESASGSYLAGFDAVEIPTYEVTRDATLPIEAIAASEPDLIVAVGWLSGGGNTGLADSYDKLASIAPVVTSPGAEDRFLVPWQESIRVLGDTLDLAAAAERVIAEDAAFFAGFREQHPEFAGLTATWAIWYDQNYGLHYLSQPGSAPEAFLSALGFAKNPLAESFATNTEVSDELLAKIDADVLMLGQSRVADPAEFTAVTEGALFQSLGAVRAGRFVTVPPVLADGGDILWGVTSGGPLGNRWAAEQLEPLLAEIR